MKNCSVTKRIKIGAGNIEDYRKLACYHYRDSSLMAYVAIFAMRFGGETVGVVVYRMPSSRCELRNVATGNLFAGFDRMTQLALINKNIRCISRVIIEPRFRGLGLASRLVRETMPRTGVPIIEGMAVMGLINPFLERAGMTAYTVEMPARCVRLIEALNIVRIEKEELVDPQKVQQKLNKLRRGEAEFIELEIEAFLQSYGKRRDMSAGLERTRFVLSKLTFRPVYYVWFNPELQLITN